MSLQLGVQSAASKLREWEKLLKKRNRIHLTGTGDKLFHDILEQEITSLLRSEMFRSGLLARGKIQLALPPKTMWWWWLCRLETVS